MPRRTEEVAALRRLRDTVRLLKSGHVELSRVWEELSACDGLAGRAYRKCAESVGGVGGGPSFLSLTGIDSQSKDEHGSTEKGRIPRRDQELKTTPKSVKESSKKGAPGETWLTSFCDAYKLTYGEAPAPVAIKRMARAFKDLEAIVPRDEVLRRFAIYLKSTPARFYSVEHFASSFPGWAQEVKPFHPRDQRPDETLDQYADRLAAM